MSWIIWAYLTILLLLIAYCLVLIGRILPLIIYVHQPLPFVPIPRKIGKAIASITHLKNAQQIVDLGCGTGSLLSAIHKQLPQAQLTGVEYKPGLLRWARWRSHWWQPKPQWVSGDMFQHPISNYDAIVGFWITKFAPKLVEKFVAECKPGCVIVSYLFPLPAHRQLKLEFPLRKDKIFVYIKI